MAHPAKDGKTESDHVLRETPRRSGAVSAFCEKLGFPLTKGNVFLWGVLYLFAWVVILFDRMAPGLFHSDFIGGGIPPVFTAILIAFPFALFAGALFFYGLHSFFSLLKGKMPFPLFAVFCIVCWLVFLLVNSFAFIRLTPGWRVLIPAGLALIISCWAAVKATAYFIIDRKPGRTYFLIHAPLQLFFLVPLALAAFLHLPATDAFWDTLFKPGSVWNVFALFAYVPLALYLLVSLHAYFTLGANRKHPQKRTGTGTENKQTAALY